MTHQAGRFLFKDDQFVYYENNQRWWSEPQKIRTHWDSLPFPSIDAAFTGMDGRTYIFHANQYVRYSTSNYSQLDDRYPAPVTSQWGRLQNNISENRYSRRCAGCRIHRNDRKGRGQNHAYLPLLREPILPLQGRPVPGGRTRLSQIHPHFSERRTKLSVTGKRADKRN